MYRTDKYVKNLLQIFLLCNKISFMNELLNKLTNYFPGVIWIDFTDSKGIENFWEILEDINTQTENPKTFLLKLFKYNKINSENSRKETFYYMLPKEEFVKEIPQEYFNKQINAFQAILDYEEVLFLKELINVLNIKESDLLNEDDGYYPVAKYYPKWNDWICSYDKHRYRFNWDSEIDYDILMYNPNDPFDAFIRKCQYAYTLLRIGIEKKTNIESKIKNELKANGFNEIANYFDLYKERQDEEAFFYNVQMGLESKANNKSHFYPKSFEESCIEIKSCLKHKRYQHKYYKDRYIFDYKECNQIDQMYLLLKELVEDTTQVVEEENHYDKLEFINRNFNKLPQYKVLELQKLNRKINIAFEENTHTEDDVLEKNSIIDTLKQEFSSSSDKPFHDILDAYAESYDKFAILDAALYEILYAKTKDISNNELFLKYLKIINKDGYAINKKIQSLFKNKINSAIEKLKGEING